jgi:hypothetical protein
MNFARDPGGPPARRRGRVLRFERLEGRRVPAVLHVGPAEPYRVPSQAAAVAHDGDTVLIDAGTYKGDVAVWKANNLTIKGVDPAGKGARAVLNDTGVAIANRKAIWVIDGNNTTVQNVEFAGAHDTKGLDRNWAGIREEGSTLTVVNCYFHNDDDGMLVNAGAASDVVVTGSEFAHNGYGDGYSHNMYIGQVRTFTLEFSDSHDAVAGHLVKSRAQTNYILYNSLTDGPIGTASYELDLPNGGLSYVIGNVIEQGPKSQNSTVLNYAEEGAVNTVQALYVVNNTFVNDLGKGTFVSVHGAPKDVRLINNLFVGGGTVLSGPGALTTNLVTNKPMFVNAAQGDYHLAKGSPAIDAGSNPDTAYGFSLTPVYQYANLAGVARPKHGAIDVGAYES